MNERKRPTAVVLDNNAASAWALALFLRDSGYRVVAGSDLESVRERLDAEGLTPNVAIRDFDLENGLNGAEATAQLQKTYEKSFPVVIVTGSDNSLPRKVARRRGFPVLAKPVDPEHLLIHINQLSSGAPDARF